MPRARNQTKPEILYKEGDILNTKVYVNWIQLLFYNERDFYHISLHYSKLDITIQCYCRLKIFPHIPKNIKTKGPPCPHVTEKAIALSLHPYSPMFMCQKFATSCIS